MHGVTDRHWKKVETVRTSSVLGKPGLLKFNYHRDAVRPSAGSIRRERSINEGTSMKYTVVVTIIAALLAPSALATPLSKEDRAFLVSKSSEGCLTGQAREAANMNLTIGKMQDFCTCYGEALISTMTVEDLAKNQETASPEMTKVSEAAFRSCAASVFKP
jgi:hypothetical protein